DSILNKTGKYESGVYRVFDKDGDDQLDTLTTLRTFEGSSGEHGPHAILLSPAGDSLYIVCGNGTKLTEMKNSRVPRVWDEDQILPRTYGRGFMKGVPAPGGYISKIDPEGKNWELIANGFRNEFDDSHSGSLGRQRGTNRRCCHPGDPDCISWRSMPPSSISTRPRRI
ncbi:MAG: hypothetical protein IID42_10800, partial [Planctomycetes bacterium]|nr:hypothetical protein [Planctomycetota bacterium]